MRCAHIVIAVAACGLPAAAQAVTYNLAADFSNAANPNGVWSFTQGATLLAHQAQPSDGNTLNPAAGNGFYGVGPTFSTAPFVIKVTQNGAATSPYNNGDFLAGDVIAHATNPGAGGPFFINWTAPSAGTINLSSAVWYAHSPVVRSDDISAILGSTVLGTVTVNNSITRTNAITSLSATNLAVTAGQVLAFRITASAGQTFGSLAGISETIDFTATPAPGVVPEPTSWAMMIAGFGMVGGTLRRRRVRVAFIA